jgi:hypothetical protein
MLPPFPIWFASGCWEAVLPVFVPCPIAAQALAISVAQPAAQAVTSTPIDCSARASAWRSSKTFTALEHAAVVSACRHPSHELVSDWFGCTNPPTSNSAAKGRPSWAGLPSPPSSSGAPTTAAASTVATTSTTDICGGARWKSNAIAKAAGPVVGYPPFRKQRFSGWQESCVGSNRNLSLLSGKCTLSQSNSPAFGCQRPGGALLWLPAFVPAPRAICGPSVGPWSNLGILYFLIDGTVRVTSYSVKLHQNTKATSQQVKF